MKFKVILFAAVMATLGFASCNVDNADSPANTVTQADTTTTDPQGLELEPGLNPAALDTAAILAADSTNQATTDMPAR
ncbi:MAG: hypothetical protein EOP56_06685 [Sphingobacteriales bacterium]|nr:MAG: hypothetical protein EOP56_06685 [Sphingobacteriales bacterium]